MRALMYLNEDNDMEYKEIQKDLFTVSDEYFLVHCISSDAEMGAGIALEFRKRYPLESLRQLAKTMPLRVGSCIVVGRVCNLVTEKNYWDKPTYKSFRLSIESLKERVDKYHIKQIALPTIGSGLDRLDWVDNRKIIRQVFSDTDIEILVCKQ